MLTATDFDAFLLHSLTVTFATVSHFSLAFHLAELVSIRANRCIDMLAALYQTKVVFSIDVH